MDGWTEKLPLNDHEVNTCRAVSALEMQHPVSLCVWNSMPACKQQDESVGMPAHTTRHIWAGERQQHTGCGLDVLPQGRDGAVHLERSGHAHRVSHTHSVNAKLVHGPKEKEMSGKKQQRQNEWRVPTWERECDG
jgi:hypothetical protein